MATTDDKLVTLSGLGTFLTKLKTTDVLKTTYATQADLGNYLTTADAATTYQAIPASDLTKTGKPTANAAPAFGGSFTVSQVSTDSSGHVTTLTDRTITFPNAVATGNADGLMSATDKAKIDNLEAIGAANAGAHNSLYRGEDITDYFNSGKMSTAIANGSFDNIYPGDYIIKSVTVNGTAYSNVKWIVGDLDYHLRRGDTQTTAHHVLMVPEGAIGTSYMNSSNVTTDGYIGSYMWTTTIPKYATGIANAFGASHVLSHRELLTNSVNANGASSGYPPSSGCSNNWAWTSVTVNIMNEPMVYGAPVFSSSGHDIGECNTQIAAFRHNKSLSFVRTANVGLRSVSNAPTFCYASNYGYASYANASYANGVRPYFLLV